VSNPGGGWDDAPDTRATIPPNPTNMQTALACTGWVFNPPCETKASRRRALGALFKTKNPGVSGLRSRSVGRTVRDGKDARSSTRHRSASPPGYLWAEPGSTFELAGILRSKARLRPAGGHTVHRGSFKTGRRFSLTKISKEDDTKNTHVGIHLEREHCPYDSKEENDIDLKYSSSSLDRNKDKKSVMNEKKEDMLKRQEPQSDEEGNVWVPEKDKTPEVEKADPWLPLKHKYSEDGNTWVPVQDKFPEEEEAEKKNVWFIKNLETEETYKKSHRCELECETVTEPYSDQFSSHCVKEFELPDQSLFEKKIKPLPPLEEFSQWYTLSNRPSNNTTTF